MIFILILSFFFLFNRGRVIQELGIRRTDIIISTKLFWGVRSGHNASGLSRKQYVDIQRRFLIYDLDTDTNNEIVSLKVPRKVWNVWDWIM